MGNVDKRVETPNQLHPQATKGVSKPRLKPCKETWKVRPSFKTVETGLNALKRRRKLEGDRGKSNYRGAKSLKNNLWGQNLFGINAASFNLKGLRLELLPHVYFSCNLFVWIKIIKKQNINSVIKIISLFVFFNFQNVIELL